MNRDHRLGRVHIHVSSGVSSRGRLGDANATESSTADV